MKTVCVYIGQPTGTLAQKPEIVAKLVQGLAGVVAQEAVDLTVVLVWCDVAAQEDCMDEDSLIADLLARV